MYTRIILLALLYLGIVMPGLEAQILIKEVMSRELSVHNSGAEATGSLGYIREVISRELCLHVGGIQTPEAKEVVSRELAVSVENGAVTDSERLLVSREISLGMGNSTPPPVVTGISIQTSPTGDSATLNWSAYNQGAYQDIAHFAIYLSDTAAFTNVTGMTPYIIAAGDISSITLNGLTPGTDHFFAIIAVDVLGNFLPTVNYAAAYVLSPQLVSREWSIFVGGEPTPPTKQAISREYSLIVDVPGSPPAITGLKVALSSTGDTATLNWNTYNVQAVQDIARFDIYLSDTGPITDVTGLTPYTSVSHDSLSALVTGLTPWTDHFFAVVAVDAQGNFIRLVNYSAGYVVSPQLVSREVSVYVGGEDSNKTQAISREVTIVVPNTAIPAPVTGLNSGFYAQTSNTQFSSVILDWSNYNEAAQIDVVRYRVYIGESFFEDVAGMAPFAYFPAGQKRQTLSGLQGLGIYHFAVVAEDALGGFDPVVRSFSSQASVSGVGEVQDLAVVSGADTLTYNWTAPAGTSGFLSGYKVYFDGSATAVELPATATSWTATGLQRGRAYTARITTINVFGSQSSGNTVLAATWLNPPTQVALTTVGEDVLLNWEPSLPANLVSYYAIYKSNADFTSVTGMTPISSRTGTSVIVGGFNEVSGQYYAVVAVNSRNSFDPAVTTVRATKQTQTVDFPAVSVGALQIPLVATASSGLPVTYLSSATSVAQVDGSTLNVLQGGAVTLTARQLGTADFWPASATQVLRFPPVITSFTLNGSAITPNQVIRQAGTQLQAQARDVTGISQIAFTGRVPGATTWSTLKLDTNGADGFDVVLPLLTLPVGPYELRAEATSSSGHVTDIIRSVVLDPAPVLSVTLGTQLVEGNSLTGTVQLLQPRPTDLVITLGSSNNTQLDAGPPVTIPAGQTSVSFQIQGRQDLVIEAPVSLKVTASASGAITVEKTVSLMDDDWPVLSFTVDRTVISESAGADAVRGRIQRDIVSSLPVTVWLTSTNTSAVSLPPIVVIPGGQASVDFSIGVVDNTLTGGNQTAALRGELRLDGAGAVVQSEVVTLNIADDEGPALELSFDSDFLMEGETGSVRLRRLRGNNTASLTVALSSSLTSELTVPSSVVIPAGAEETSFNVTAVVDAQIDGNQGVRINATTSVTYSPAQLQIIVTDTSLPDLRVSTLTSPSGVKTERQFDLTYTISNQGGQAVTQDFTQSVYLSKDRVLGNDSLLSQSRFVGGLAAGSNFTRTDTVLAPREAGDYWLIIHTDANRAISEVLESNNIRISAIPLVVTEAYSATVQTEATVVPNNTPIVFTGSAFDSTAAKVPNALVNVIVKLGLTKRVIPALTNASGDYTVTWQPLPNEGGNYQVAATHPGTADGSNQDFFAILTLEASLPQQPISFDEGSSTNFVIKLNNPTSHPANGIQLQGITLPPGLSLQANLPAANLLAGQEMDVPVTLTASTGYSGAGPITIRISTTEGIELEAPLELQVRPLFPKLALTPNPIACSVLRGSQKMALVTVENQGGAATGAINVSLPNVPWMEMASSLPLPSIPAGGTASFSILLKPAATDALTLHQGAMVISPAAGPASNLPFAIRVVSDLRADLEVEVVDEYFFFTPEAPKLEGATVVVRDPITREQIQTLTTTSTGTVTFPQLTEGWYTLEVTAPQHNRWSANIEVVSGPINRRRIFISKEMVTYNWKVEEIEIQDRYKITVESTFETNVPAPVVTLEPATLDVSDLELLGQTKVVNMIVENHGWIAADQGTFNFESHPFYEITPLVNELGTIPAKTAIAVPVVLRRKAVFAEDGSIQTLAVGGKKSSAGSKTTATTSVSSIKTASTNIPCGMRGGLAWNYECGKEKVGKGTPIPVNGVQGHCPPGAARPYTVASGYWVVGGGSGGSGSGSGGGGYSGSVGYTKPKPCDCGWFDKLCITAEGKISLEGIGKALAGALSKALPPWIKIEEVNVEVGANGELCVCCKDGEYGMSGEGTATASISGTAVIGYAGDIEFKPENLPGWTEVEASASALAGVRIGIEGQVSATLQQECLGEPNICVTGSVGLNAFAGLDLQGSASAKWSVPNTNVEVAYSGDATGTLGIAGSASASVTGCLDGALTYKACGSIEPKATLQLELKATGYEDQTLGGSVDLPKFQAGDCGDDAGRAARVVAKGSSSNVSTRDTSPGTPIIIEEPGNQYIIPDAQIIQERFPQLIKTDGVCSVVKIKIDQDLVMTRSAFRATLELTNKPTDSSLTNVGFDLNVSNPAGPAADDVFNTRVTKLQGLSAIDGTGTIGPASSGSAEWTLIPRDTAAPLADTKYLIGGIIRYTQNGVNFSVPVEPVEITVRPDAALHLKYFHQRDVFSDDPHTEAFEAPVPYNLAVLLENKGAGSAKNLKITSAQPQIIENEKGLLIDFRIIGTRMGSDPRSPSLEADFGTILPNQRRVATWDITSSLQGLFVDYKATFEHVDGLGDPRLSLIKDVSIHEMIKMVEVTGTQADGLPDFLVNDLPDANDRPDTLHFSQGSTAAVTVFETANVTGTVSATNLSVTVTSSQGTGWSYLRLPDPANGAFRLASVRRSDNATLPLTNVWLTDRTFIGLGKRPIKENILHLLDNASTGSYTLTYAPKAADTTPPTSSVQTLPAQSPLFIPVRWSGTDNDTLAYFDVYVSENGGPYAPWLTKSTRISYLYQGQVGKTYSFYSRATDAAGNLEAAPTTPQATTTVSITQGEPELSAIGNRSINERQNFRLTATATDDAPLNQLYYTLETDNNSLTINSITGELSWLTQETDGGRVVSATVTVYDSGLPSLSDSETFTITVEETNEAPLVPALPPTTFKTGQQTQLSVPASDPDLPAQTLSYSLSGAVPAGLSINASSGLLSWQPPTVAETQTPIISITVTDNGTPAKSTTVLLPLTLISTGSGTELPTVTTNTTATQIASTSLVAAGEVTAEGTSTVTERGMVASLLPGPTTSSTGVIRLRNSSGTGTYNAYFTGLRPGFTYYLRAYAINSSGTAYGEDVAVDALPATPGQRRVLYLKAGDPALWSSAVNAYAQSIEIQQWRDAGYEVALGDAVETQLTSQTLAQYHVVRLFADLPASSYPESSATALYNWIEQRGGAAIIESTTQRSIAAVRRFGVERIQGQAGGSTGATWAYVGNPLLTSKVTGPLGPLTPLAAQHMDTPVLAKKAPLKVAAGVGKTPAVAYADIGLGRVVTHFIEGWSHDSTAAAALHIADINDGANMLYLGKLMDYVGRPTRWDNQVLDAGMVAQPVEIDLTGEGWSVVKVSGLPPGLKYDSSAGLITGLSGRSGVFIISVSLREGSGPVIVQKFNLKIAPLPASAVGNFVAPLDRDILMNDNLGGILSFTSSAAGAVTGKLVEGPTTYSFKGKLTSNGSQRVLMLATITRKKQSSVELILYAENNLLTGTVSDSSTQRNIIGWRNVWNKKTPATNYAGDYSSGWDISTTNEGQLAIPQGTGFSTMKMDTLGKVQLTGRLSDGTAVSQSTLAGPTGELAHFQLLYSKKGSLTGRSQILIDNVPKNTRITGTLSWLHPASSSAQQRQYPAAFGPLDLTVSGGRYLPPQGETLVMGIDPNRSKNTRLIFTSPQGTELQPPPPPDITLTIGKGNKITLPKGVTDNPRNTSFKLNAKTGAFSGQFLFKDPNPLAPSKTLSRKGSFTGTIIRSGNSQRGYGYYLLPELPTATQTNASATPILSGQVILEVAP